ncbi:YwaF family protein [Mediterraneibacter glycyrrhizinilyticus]|nr:YwaF family protein [Mediterraneibacter glycyrrhizinilyticus]
MQKIRQVSFPRRSDRLFFLCGVIMFISEIWKQITLTFVLGGGRYNWWYFPFQLCSIPMYLLLLYPWLRQKVARRILLTFLMSYTLLGGISVFADPSGLHYPLVSLTVHSYLWHILLILIGILSALVYFRCAHEKALRAFAGSTGLYLFCCVLAELFNLSFDRFGTINMFYINPGYQMQQIIFSDLSVRIGNTPAILLYMVSTILGAFFLFLIWQFIFLLLGRS